jgi:hypothetical protein
MTAVDWDLVEALAAHCGSRAQGLAVVHYLAGLTAWAAWAAENTRSLSPGLADLHEQLHELVADPRVVPLGSVIGDVDRHGDLAGGA